jgi:hypothetical protein
MFSEEYINHCCGSGSVCQNISQNHRKLLQKSTKIIRISYIFSKILNLCITDTNIYPINNKTDHFLQKYILNRKKVKKIRIRYFTKRIRIHIKIKRIRNTDLNKTISCEEKGQGTEFSKKKIKILKN